MRARAAGSAVPADLLDDLCSLRKASGEMSRVDHRAVDRHVESAGASCHELRGVSERALDFSRQTGGLRLIASTRAVGDRDLHESFPRDGKSILDAA